MGVRSAQEAADGAWGPGGGGVETRQTQRRQTAAQQHLHVVSMLLPRTGGEHVRIKLSSTVKFLWLILGFGVGELR